MEILILNMMKQLKMLYKIKGKSLTSKIKK